MKWVEMVGGTALYVNGRLVGWVTSTLNGRYLHGMTPQSASMKTPLATKHEAKLALMKAIGD
jgi:hypothetical protein